jgi:hypothetical protein
MDEVLSWEEIERRYPDEWVIVTDLELDDAFPIRAGRVLFHSKDRRNVDEKTFDPPIREEGIFFTGDLADRVFML